jgi:hypothetical protein
MASFRILACTQYFSLLTLKRFSWKSVILLLIMLHEIFNVIILADGASQNVWSFVVKNEVILLAVLCSISLDIMLS